VPVRTSKRPQGAILLSYPRFQHVLERNLVLAGSRIVRVAQEAAAILPEPD